MPRNHGSRARRPWARLPRPEGPWAPLAAIAPVVAMVALVAQGPRIGGAPPTVPDGRASAAVDQVEAGDADIRPDLAVAGGHARPSHGASTADGAAPTDDREPDVAAAERPRARTPTAPRSRTRARPSSSHRQRRQPGGRKRAPATTGTRRGPAPPPVRSPASVAAPGSRPAAPPVRRPSTPHRAATTGSAEREFGAP